MKSEERIDQLKQENKVLKSILKKINKMELYEIDYDYYGDNLEQLNIPFDLIKLIKSQTKNEDFETKRKILSYFKHK